MRIRLLAAIIAVAGVAAGCGSSAVSPSEKNAGATAAWITATKFAGVVGDLQNDTDKIALATRKHLPVLTMQTLCGILLLDVQSANNDLPAPDRTATKLLAAAYGDLGAGANQCFKVRDYGSPLMAKSVENRSQGLISLAQATSHLELVIGQPIPTTTTTTTMP